MRLDIALLLLLPLVGGYLFSINWLLSRFHVARRSGYPLYFSTLFYATFCFITAFIIYLWLLTFPTVNAIIYSDVAKESFRFLFKPNQEKANYELLLIAILSLFVGALGWFPLNRILRLVWFIRRLIGGLFPTRKSLTVDWKTNIALPPMLWKAIKDDDELTALFVIASTMGKPVCITVDNRKVYVGYLLNMPDPINIRKSVTLLPLLSGYRDREIGVLRFTTHYNDVYDQLIDQNDHPKIDLFRLVIPLNRVCTVGLFDIILYEKFYKHNLTGITVKTERRSKRGRRSRQTRMKKM